MLLNLLVLSFLPSVIGSNNSLAGQSVWSPQSFYNDDDFVPNNFNQLKSKFGNVEFNVRIYSNSSCGSIDYLESNYSFNFPSECTCFNSNINSSLLLNRA